MKTKGRRLLQGKQAIDYFLGDQDVEESPLSSLESFRDWLRRDVLGSRRSRVLQVAEQASWKRLEWEEMRLRCEELDVFDGVDIGDEEVAYCHYVGSSVVLDENVVEQEVQARAELMKAMGQVEKESGKARRRRRKNGKKLERLAEAIVGERYRHFEIFKNVVLYDGEVPRAEFDFLVVDVQHGQINEVVAIIEVKAQVSDIGRCFVKHQRFLRDLVSGSYPDIVSDPLGEPGSYMVVRAQHFANWRPREVTWPLPANFFLENYGFITTNICAFPLGVDSNIYSRVERYLCDPEFYSLLIGALDSPENESTMRKLYLKILEESRSRLESLDVFLLYRACCQEAMIMTLLLRQSCRRGVDGAHNSKSLSHRRTSKEQSSRSREFDASNVIEAITLGHTPANLRQVRSFSVEALVLPSFEYDRLLDAEEEDLGERIFWGATSFPEEEEFSFTTVNSDTSLVDPDRTRNSDWKTLKTEDDIIRHLLADLLLDDKY